MEYSLNTDNKKQYLIIKNYMNEIRNSCPDKKDCTDGQILHAALMSFQREYKVPHTSICNNIDDN